MPSAHLCTLLSEHSAEQSIHHFLVCSGTKIGFQFLSAASLIRDTPQDNSCLATSSRILLRGEGRDEKPKPFAAPCIVPSAMFRAGQSSAASAPRFAFRRSSLLPRMSNCSRSFLCTHQNARCRYSFHLRVCALDCCPPRRDRDHYRYL